MKKISQSIVSAIPFPVGYSVDCQHRIIENLDSMSATVRKLTTLQAESHCLSEALIPSVLDRAFKGEL